MDRQLHAKLVSIAASQLGLVSPEQLAELRVSKSARDWLVRRGEYRRLPGGVLASTAVPATPAQAALAAVLAAGEAALASMTTAAALHEVRRFHLDACRPWVAVPPGSHPRGVPATIVRTNSLPPAHGTVCKGVPVTTVARTLFDLARILRPERLERAVDDALAQQLVTIDELDEILWELAAPGRKGTRAFRAIMHERGDGFVATRSRLERRFFDLAREFGLPEPRREIDFGGEEKWTGRVEFGFDHGVLVEIDARRWHEALKDLEHDDERDNEFNAQGFAVLRFRYRKLADDPAGVADLVRRAIARAARRSLNG